jgi:hypothetical protein
MLDSTGTAYCISNIFLFDGTLQILNMEANSYHNDLPVGSKRDIPHKNLNKKKKKKVAGVQELGINGKKLLIFDINKVLLYRQPKTSRYYLRPHAHEFIASMASRFNLAVWTSMTKSSGKRILDELFYSKSVPLLFHWFQNRCTAIKDKNNIDAKPIFMKKLTQVWHEHKMFNESNTVRKYAALVSFCIHCIFFLLR